MTDRPMLFSTPMIKALKAGKKTQTRRPAWRQVITHPDCPKSWLHGEHRPDGYTYLRTIWQKAAPGDRIWVRETWGERGATGYNVVNGVEVEQDADWIVYRADGEDGKRWMPSIFMPRSASRITLVVTDVRRQRLQDITVDDIVAEGVKEPFSQFTAAIPGPAAQDAWEEKAWLAWQETWDSIHGAGAWDDNPEVIALTFDVHMRNIDEREAA